MTAQDRTDSGSDSQAERLVADAFATFREEHRSSFTAPGVAAVHAAARADRRRRGILSAVAAAAVLAVLAGTAAMLTWSSEPERRPSATEGTVTATPPTVSPTPGRSRSPKATASRDGSPTQRPNPRRVDVRNATIEVGPMDGTGCSGGVLTFAGGQSGDSSGCQWMIGQGGVEYGNVDGSSGAEVVTTIAAGPANAEYTPAVIAFRITGSGRLATMGYVFVGLHSSQTVMGFWIASGEVGVTIRDTSWNPEQPQQQQRGYRWNGAGFGQVWGPTEFSSPEPPPDPEPEPSDPSPSAASPAATE